MSLTGLHYGCAQVAWELGGVEMTPDLFAEVQLIERGAIEAFEERSPLP